MITVEFDAATCEVLNLKDGAFGLKLVKRLSKTEKAPDKPAPKNKKDKKDKDEKAPPPRPREIFLGMRFQASPEVWANCRKNVELILRQTEPKTVAAKAMLARVPT